MTRAGAAANPTSNAIKQRQEALMKSLSQEKMVPPPPPTLAKSPSGDVLKKASNIGAALALTMTRGPPPSIKSLIEQKTGTHPPPLPGAPVSPRQPPPQHLLQPTHPTHPSTDDHPPPPPPPPPHADDHDDEGKDDLDPPPTSTLVNPDKAGILEKRGTGVFNSAFKSRYIILKGACLYWLKSKNDPKPAGMLRLNERGLIINTPDDYTMEITTHKKTYVFRSGVAAELSSWVKACRACQVDDFKADDVASAPAHDPTADVERLKKMLVAGNVFIKYKHKKGKERMIWCPSSFDRILWGDMQKKNVKGFVMLKDVVRISDGCFGSKRNENAFTLVATQRTLELEASSKQEKLDWVHAIQHFIDARS